MQVMKVKIAIANTSPLPTLAIRSLWPSLEFVWSLICWPLPETSGSKEERKAGERKPRGSAGR